MSIPYIISILLSPILGLGIDFFGHRADINTLSCVLLIFVHVLLAYSDIGAVVPLVGQGLVYSGFAAVSCMKSICVYAHNYLQFCHTYLITHYVHVCLISVPYSINVIAVCTQTLTVHSPYYTTKEVCTNLYYLYIHIYTTGDLAHGTTRSTGAPDRSSLRTRHMCI